MDGFPTCGVRELSKNHWMRLYSWSRHRSDENLEELIAQDQKTPVGEMEIIPVQEDSSLPEGHHTFEFRLHYTASDRRTGNEPRL